ncbi:hypothetical protein ACFOD4_13685 [Pseudoroseomonas globiformis]|uniref:Uncharacterized protein n=1 Tax=Teichococcus globiformis TaxID=2307229 RepID=A0ABV7G3I6_9PROT
MQIIRHAPGEASLLQEGHTLLDITQADTGEAEFETLLDRLAQALDPARMPRLAVTLREGLIETVLSEVPVEVHVIEEDPHDEPSLRLVRRVAEVDPSSLAQLLDSASRRLARERS